MRTRDASNPFCTRFFQPGSVPVFLHPPITVDVLVHRIVGDAYCRFAIVGPHGSGKSTLLSHLLQHPAISNLQGSMIQISFHADETRRHRWHTLHKALISLTQDLPASSGQESRVPPVSLKLLVVDGWEQMDSVLQWFARARAGARNVRILATSHALPTGFDELWRTRVDATVEQHVLGHMLKDCRLLKARDVLESQAWHVSRERHGQNLRETLFDMYDWYRDQVDAPSVSG